MKYIASNTSTKSLLQEWTGDQRLVIVDSYLWNPGSKMQRTEQGLLQSMLYQLLKCCPALIEKAAPERWAESVSFHRNPRQWSLEELRNAFANVFDGKAAPKDRVTGQTLPNTSSCQIQDDEDARRERELNAHFFFLIDGLDEYQGEQWRLVDTVKSLASNLRIKICVSSRSWNVFQNAFSHLRSQLRLEQLTHGDITHYVESELNMVSEKYGKEARMFVSSIVEKAEGVFFWVYLVVRSLREGFEEGDSIKLMHQRLNDFPADLGEYFEHILTRVSKTYRAQTSQALKLATLTLGGKEIDDSDQIYDSACFITFWLLSQGCLEDPQFAFRRDFNGLYTKELIEMAKSTRKFLNACCKDFLHFPSLDDPLLMKTNPLHAVQYLHRTVYEFLTSDDMGHILNRYVPEHFLQPIFPAHVALARSKLVPMDRPKLCRYCVHIASSAINIQWDFLNTETVAEYEKVAVCYLENVCNRWCELHHSNEEGVPAEIRELLQCFNAFGLHTLAKLTKKFKVH